MAGVCAAAKQAQNSRTAAIVRNCFIGSPLEVLRQWLIYCEAGDRGEGCLRIAMISEIARNRRHRKSKGYRGYARMIADRGSRREIAVIAVVAGIGKATATADWRG